MADLEAISRDHIFPQFLGGSRTIATCAKCNNTFGSNFEAKAASQLLAFQMMLASVGLPQLAPKNGTRWPGAWEHEGVSYDMEIRDGKAILVHSKPKVTRDEAGNLVSVTVRSEDELKKLIRRVGPASGESRRYSEAVPFDDRSLPFHFGPHFGRFVIKMSSAFATCLPSFDPRDISSATEILRGDESEVLDARQDFRSFPAVDSLMPLLSHGIYVERNSTGLHGFVVLFGVVRMYCRLGSATVSPEPRAMLGILDVWTGEEKFALVEPVGITEAPLDVPAIVIDQGLKHWSVVLNDQIKKAGVKGWSARFPVPIRTGPELWRRSTSNTFDHWWNGTVRLLLRRGDS